uniref:Esterase n=1 Tax=Gossypium raimondii TaxID=29730 RepID=A0A0D2SDC9_GOSRA|nr:hypothetical protein B456_005G089600 [Gossypium raimondii]
MSLFLFMLLVSILNPVVSHKSCDFPAVFNLGDSNSDTGGYASAFTPPTSPYGDTYFHMPARRFSDGRLTVDFIAEAFGLPFINAYLDSVGTNFSHGINFATAASTIRLPISVIPNGVFSPFYLGFQYSQFEQFKVRSQMIRKQEGFFSNLTIQEVNASIPDIINKFSANIKNIYNLGARFFWVHNTGPIGCLPYVLIAFASAEKDPAGCLKPYNEVAQYFNLKLQESIAQLRNEFPSAAFTYVDIYSVKYSLFAEPQKHGFELPLVTCCGYGGEYNYSAAVLCGGTITVNGTEIFVGSCDNPSVRVVWDGIHFTEAANKFIFDQISTGSFSDPAVPLKQACQS